jgi:hypothetical protein
MTIEEQYYTGEGYIQDEPQEYPGATHLEQPIPVVSLTENLAPEYGACMTWSVPQAGVGTNQPVQLLTRRIRRSQAKLFITALGGATSVVLNSKLDPLQGLTPQGAVFLTIGRLPDWENQQPLWAIALGGGPVTIAVFDDSYAER